MLLATAEVQFKFALALETTVASGAHQFTYLDQFAWGKHAAARVDLALSKEQEELGAALIVHSATYVMAVQMDAAMQDVFPDRFRHSDPDVQAAAWIARLIRNSFAHNPLDPQWQVQPEARGKRYQVEDLIVLDTGGLEGKRVTREHYGGPLALLRLLQFVRARVEQALAA